MSLQNQNGRTFLGQTQAMLCNQFTKNVYSVYVAMCVCIFKVYL